MMFLPQRRKDAKPAGFVWGFSLRLGVFAGIVFLLSSPAVHVSQKKPPQSELYGPPVTIATVKERAISESSGLVASRQTPDAYWTHNDSGGGPFIYSFDSSGNSLGIFNVNGAQNRHKATGHISTSATSATTTMHARTSLFIAYRNPR
jgi:hypothetical protein